jgi:hypothetical protein
LKGSFGVDVGAIQLATVLKSKKPRDIENAIISSGKLLQYAVVRIDKASSGYQIRCRFCGKRPNQISEWTINHIGRLNTDDWVWLQNYVVRPNGRVWNKKGQYLGNWKTQKFA